MISVMPQSIKQKIVLIIFLVVCALCFFGNTQLVHASSQSGLKNPHSIIEYLRLSVPSEGKQAWLAAEKDTWEPWLLQQKGFLGRQLFWDPQTEEATVLITWKSRKDWKTIPQSEINIVQDQFEELAMHSTGQTKTNPFPIKYQSELIPQ